MCVTSYLNWDICFGDNLMGDETRSNRCFNVVVFFSFNLWAAHTKKNAAQHCMKTCYFLLLWCIFPKHRTVIFDCFFFFFRNLLVLSNFGIWCVCVCVCVCFFTQCWHCSPVWLEFIAAASWIETHSFRERELLMYSLERSEKYTEDGPREYEVKYNRLGQRVFS